MGDPRVDSAVDHDYTRAYNLAQRTENTEQRRLLVKATSRALEMDQRLAEAEQLLAFWRTMPEHITGSQAIRQLDEVLRGVRAPRSASAPKP